MLRLALSVTDDVIQNIAPIQQAMEDGPADGMPVDIGHRCGQHHTEEKQPLRVERQGEVGPVPGPGFFDHSGSLVVGLSVDHLFHGHTE